jgi:hypothetical protein
LLNTASYSSCDSDCDAFSVKLERKEFIGVEFRALTPLCPALRDCRRRQGTFCLISDHDEDAHICNEDFEWEFYSNDGSEFHESSSGSLGAIKLIIGGAIAVVVLIIVIAAVVIYARARRHRARVLQMMQNPAVVLGDHPLHPQVANGFHYVYDVPAPQARGSPPQKSNSSSNSIPDFDEDVYLAVERAEQVRSEANIMRFIRSQDSISDRSSSPDDFSNA